MKSVLYSVAVFLIVGPCIGAIIVSVVAGESPIDILFFAYFMGLIPAAAACVINWLLFLSLKGKNAIPNYLIGIASGLILLVVIVIVKGLPNHLSNGLVLLLIFTVSPAICSSIANSYATKRIYS